MTTDAYINNLVFSPDNKLLLGSGSSSSDEGAVLYLWETSTGKLLRSWKGPGSRFIFHPNGVTLAAADDQSGKLMLFDLRTGELLWEMQGQSDIREIAFNPDGSLLVSANEDGIEFWDMASDKLLRTIEGSFYCPVFSPDGRLLAVSLPDGRIQYWGVKAE